MRPWTQTWTPHAVDLLDPEPADISVHDVAHALSLLPRFTGHTDVAYSVAQHSVLVSDVLIADPRMSFEGLLHDAPEAYLNDLSAPVKRAMRELMGEICHDGQMPVAWVASNLSPYDELERRMRLAVAARFGLEPEVPDCVKEADLRMLETERIALMANPPKPWELGVDPYPIEVVPWPATEAEDRFLARFESLGGKL